MHVVSGERDPAVSFPLASPVDDVDERRRANRAVAVSAAGLAVTGLVELVIALVSGSVALLGDALHNLSDVSTSLLVFVGFRATAWATKRFAVEGNLALAPSYVAVTDSTGKCTKAEC